MIRSFVMRLRRLLFRRHADAELDEELRYHLTREIERNVANGMGPAAARDAARRAFGNMTVATEQARDAWQWRWIEELSQDVVYSLRTFTRAPLFVVTVVATIGLALGLNTTVFTIFNAYVLRPLTVRDPYALYSLTWRDRGGSQHATSWAQYRALRAEGDVFSDLAAERFIFARVGSLPTYGRLVTSNYFTMLGVEPALGRTLLPSDGETPGSPAAIVLSYTAWQNRFGGDSSIVGKTLSIHGYPMTVVGVAREGFGGLVDTPMEFWAPVTMLDELEHIDLLDATQPEAVDLVGHLRPGVGVERARAELATWMRRMTADRPPGARLDDALLVARATAITVSPELLLLFSPIAAAFVLVMLIACANVANMMLARALARQREVGIRLALGAGRARLVRQLLTEAAVLAVPAALLGFVTSRLTLDLGVRTMFATIPADFAPYVRMISLAPDARVFLFMVIGAAASAVLFGLAPALKATRPDVVQAARGDFDTALRPSRLRNGLLATQVTGCVLLLICTGVLLTGARRLGRLDVGFRTRDVVSVELQHPVDGRAIDAIRDGASSRRIAAVSSVPLNGALPRIPVSSDDHHLVASSFDLVSPSYFAVLDIPIVRGRNFTDDESRQRAPVVIVSESSARQFWPGTDAIGRTLRIAVDTAGERHERGRFGPYMNARLRTYVNARVVGVARDAIVGFVGFGIEPSLVYYPAPIDSSVSYLMRVGGDAEAARRPISDAILGEDPSALSEMHTLREALALQVYPFRAAYWVAAALGAIALLLTLTGVYGVLSYIVAQRTREIGIRVALGASRAHVVAIVLRQSLRFAIGGVALGAGLALGASKALSSAFVMVIDAYDPLSYAGAIGLVLVSCVAAAYVPSRRAASVNPVEALRADS